MPGSPHMSLGAPGPMGLYLCSRSCLGTIDGDLTTDIKHLTRLSPKDGPVIGAAACFRQFILSPRALPCRYFCSTMTMCGKGTRRPQCTWLRCAMLFPASENTSKWALILRHQTGRRLPPGYGTLPSSVVPPVPGDAAQCLGFIAQPLPSQLLYTMHGS